MRFPFGILFLVLISVFFFIITKFETLWSHHILSLFYYEIATIRNGEFWRIILGPFIHFNWPHFLANTIFLGIFGAILERRFGTKMMLLVFIISNIIGFAFIHFIYNYSGVYGISGSVCGLYGFLLMHLKKKQGLLQWFKQNWIYLLYGTLLIIRALTSSGLHMLHLFGIIIGGIIAIGFSKNYDVKLGRYTVIFLLIGALLLLLDPGGIYRKYSQRNVQIQKIQGFNTCEDRASDSIRHLSKESSLLQILAGWKVQFINLPDGPKEIKVLNRDKDFIMKPVLLNNFSMNIPKNATIQITDENSYCKAFRITEEDAHTIINYDNLTNSSPDNY